MYLTFFPVHLKWLICDFSQREKNLKITWIFYPEYELPFMFNYMNQVS